MSVLCRGCNIVKDKSEFFEVCDDLAVCVPCLSLIGEEEEGANTTGETDCEASNALTGGGDSEGRGADSEGRGADSEGRGADSEAPGCDATGGDDSEGGGVDDGGYDSESTGVGDGGDGSEGRGVGDGGDDSEGRGAGAKIADEALGGDVTGGHNKGTGREINNNARGATKFAEKDDPSTSSNLTLSSISISSSKEDSLQNKNKTAISDMGSSSIHSNLIPTVKREGDLMNAFSACEDQLFTFTAFKRLMLHRRYRDWKYGVTNASLQDNGGWIVFESNQVRFYSALTI